MGCEANVEDPVLATSTFAFFTLNRSLEMSRKESVPETNWYISTPKPYLRKI
jgi:hypothetical protein